MSTEYTFGCKTCHKTCEDGINHAEDRLKILLKHKDAIKELVDVAWVMIEISGYSSFADFLTEHCDHDVVVVDEYGRVDGKEVKI